MALTLAKAAPCGLSRRTAVVVRAQQPAVPRRAAMLGAVMSAAAAAATFAAPVLAKDYQEALAA